MRLLHEMNALLFVDVILDDGRHQCRELVAVRVVQLQQAAEVFHNGLGVFHFQLFKFWFQQNAKNNCIKNYCFITAAAAA